MKNILLLFTLMSISTCFVYAQKKTITGRVINDLFEPVPFASIIIEDTVQVGKTDPDGLFNIQVPVSVKTITFYFLGNEKTAIQLQDYCDEADVIMIVSSTYDFMSLKKVDKLRLKRFKQLPKKHREAFEKGIFKTDRACYTQVFEPYFKEKTI